MKNGAPLTEQTQDSTAIFSGIVAGEYEMQVSAAGYKTAKEHAIVFANGASTTVYVYLHSETEASPAAAAMPIMTPHLRGEVEKGIYYLRRKEYAAARVQFDKAATLAPGNPDVQYLLGALESSQQHYDAARQKFQAALAIYPSHERALLALGELQLRSGDPVSATATLEKAFAMNGADWRTHFLLASAYLAQKNFDEALTHARRAAAIAKQQAPSAWMLVSEILVQMKEPEQARETWAKVLHDFPKDAAASQAQAQLAALSNEQKEPPTIALPRAATAALLAPAHPTSLTFWAPADIDEKEYDLQNVSCSEDELLQKTQTRVLRQLAGFEKFTATEHIEHQRVDSYGLPEQIHSKDFSYVVLLAHPRPDLTFIDERRDGRDDLSSFPTPLATEGLFALALNIFGPNFHDDLDFRCEGLRTWRGLAAWQVRLEQKPNVPAHIRLWWEAGRSTVAPERAGLDQRHQL
jgi:tetratricopeptide (TPR) repeat protein